MKMIPALLKELEQEAKTTRKMLTAVPDGKYDWKPHEKSMTIQMLSTHIVELTTWISMAINTSELDFSKSAYSPVTITNTKELLVYFEKCLVEGRASLENANEEQLNETWKLRNGDEIYFSITKAETIRYTYCQIVHHRAQLGVYLRLLNIPIPGSYGPSADDASFN